MENKFSLHLRKTKSILFGSKIKKKKVEIFDVKCGNGTIKEVNCANYLRVQIDNDLSKNSIVKDIKKGKF